MTSKPKSEELVSVGFKDYKKMSAEDLAAERHRAYRMLTEANRLLDIAKQRMQYLEDRHRVSSAELIRYRDLLPKIKSNVFEMKNLMENKDSDAGDRQHTLVRQSAALFDDFEADVKQYEESNAEVLQRIAAFEDKTGAK
ncbi:unnamed protein product [Medioppia subpectinata]|uniref:Uncharacterized protein n=1 Tax=Medioppia subpectinata TaxID=1979941 RepID=A0A7R9LEP3_9ACAR|nr:unnamed protein product [Medioppia subpectinata]CAG2117649.1 unnamed protein product [Medioppia subpectinata]